MSDKKPEILRISRLLTPEHRADVRAWVQLAYIAETSARKQAGAKGQSDTISSLHTHEYSCNKNSGRRTK